MRQDYTTQFIRSVVHPLWALKDGSRHLSYLRLYEQTQYWPTSRLEEMRWRRLERLLAHAYESSPFYRERFRRQGLEPRHIQAPEDLVRIPVLTKEEIQRWGKSMVSSTVPARELIADLTGGSTGRPLRFWRDRDADWHRRAAAFRHNRMAGWDLGERVGVLWGARRDLAGLRGWKAELRARLLERQRVLDASSMGPEEMARFAVTLRRFRPKVLLGYAKAMAAFARFLREEGRDSIEPESIVTSAEMLEPDERTLIESVFGCPVYNRYGCREVGLIASECEHHDGLHINAESLYVEIVAQGEPAPPGELGQVVITDLVNYAMPMIRYQIEDCARPAARTCRCGRSLPLIEGIAGRTTDFLLLPDGRLVSGAALTIYLVAKIRGIAQAQLIQENRAAVTVRLVPDVGFGEATLDSFRAEARAITGEGIAFRFELCERIEREPSGKYRFCISRMAEEMMDGGRAREGSPRRAGGAHGRSNGREKPCEGRRDDGR
jgi:phenylacetate-CoA ligase